MDEDVPHLAGSHRDHDGRYGAPSMEDDDGGFSIERALLELDRRADRLAADDLQQRGDLSPADDGAADVADAAVAHDTRAGVGDEDGVFREHLEQRVLVAAGGGLDERGEQPAVLVARSLENPAFGRHMLPRTLEKLAASGVALAEQRGNLRVTHIEDVVQEEDRALGGGEALEEDQECHRDLVEHLEAPDAGVLQVHWLRQAIAPALLASRTRRAELVQANARDRREEARLGRINLPLPLPTHPSFLHYVLVPCHLSHPAVGQGEPRRAPR